MKLKVAIIILNWNGWKDTIECLESLYQINYLNYDVILVDNNSEDDSIEKITAYCNGELKIESEFLIYNTHNKPIKILKDDFEDLNKLNEFKNISSSEKLILIKNDENYGFAEGNNIAIRFSMDHVNPEYILLLNNDTKVSPDFLDELILIAESESKVGIVGPKLLNAYDPQIIDSTGHIIKWGRIIDRGHGKTDKGQYDNHKEVIGAMAAAALYKKEMLQEIGLLDPTYETLYEDADLSWRAHNNGWKSMYAPKSVVYHKRGKSITKPAVMQKMIMLGTKNICKTVINNGNSLQKCQILLILFKNAILIILGRILNRNEVSLKSYLKVFYESWINVLFSIFNK